MKKKIFQIENEISILFYYLVTSYLHTYDMTYLYWIDVEGQRKVYLDW